MHELPDCIVCGLPGKRLYNGLNDRLGLTRGPYNFNVCPVCRTLWLDPMPDTRDIPAFYKGYFLKKEYEKINAGHSRRFLAGVRDLVRNNIIYGYYGYRHLAKNKACAWMGSVLGAVPFFRSRANYTISGYCPFKHPDPQALLVDVGCGPGDYLCNLRSLGWKVLGIEPDPEAAAIAGSKGIPVFHGTLEQAGLPAGSADYITLMHVIEHIPDPQALIEECLRVLKNNGKLVIRTPNAASLGHQVFKENYFSLEPPRHLFLFTPQGLERILNKCGLKNVPLRTITASAYTSYDNSVVIRRSGMTSKSGVKPQRGRNWFSWKEAAICRMGRQCGEEIEAVIAK